MTRPRPNRVFRLRLAIWRAIVFPIAWAVVRLAYSAHPAADHIRRGIVIQTLTRMSESGHGLRTLQSARADARTWEDQFWPVSPAVAETQA